MLLHKDTRESLGIELQGNIVILDEAHNIIDAINNMYSVELNQIQVSQMKKNNTTIMQPKHSYSCIEMILNCIE